MNLSSETYAVTLGGKTYPLPVTIEAALAIEAAFDGGIGRAWEALTTRSITKIGLLIATVQPKPLKPDARKLLADAIWKIDPAGDELMPLVDYIECMQRGGRPKPEDAETEAEPEGDEGNG